MINIKLEELKNSKSKRGLVYQVIAQKEQDSDPEDPEDLTKAKAIKIASKYLDLNYYRVDINVYNEDYGEVTTYILAN